MPSFRAHFVRHFTEDTIDATIIRALVLVAGAELGAVSPDVVFRAIIDMTMAGQGVVESNPTVPFSVPRNLRAHGG